LVFRVSEDKQNFHGGPSELRNCRVT
jgi:hypothetical protein